MDVRNPALYENGQYLFEWDSERPDRYSEAAKKAQEAVSRRLRLHQAHIISKRFSTL